MTPTEIRSVECPYCEAKPGEHCLTMNGNLTGKFGTRVNHYRREVAARRHSGRSPAERIADPCLPGYTHYVIRESDGVLVCQICGDVK